MANWTPKSVKKAMYIGGLACILFVVGLIGSSFFEYKECSKKNNYGLPDPDEVLPARWGAVRLFQNEAICVDGTVCAEIGRSMFYRNGSVVDAAIATMICNGIVNMQSMGVGGGFLMTIYKRDTREAYVLNARDRAPHDLNSSIFENNDPRDSFQGPLAIAVPGEVAGYWAAHKKFGKIKWRELFEPSIKLCEDGYKMTKYQRDSVILTGKAIYNDPILKERFINPKTNEIKAVGSLIKSKLLCETLRNISIKGASDFYQGEIGKNLINDLKKKGALMTLEDLENYDAKWQKPVETTFSNGVTLKTVGLPGSGGPLALILNILDGYNFTSKDIEDFTSTTKTYHKVVEAFKYAFALRSNLGDPDFTDMEDIMKNFTSKNFADAIRNKISLDKTWEDPNHYGATSSFTDDHGTSHIAILGPNGDGVSVTSSINFYFGSGIVSESTGIILNNVIDDFGVLKKSNFHGIPANKNNFVQPFKQPISSMSPSILTEPNGDIKLLVGAAGGTKIITSITQIIARMLWMDQTIKEAVEAPRIHHQLIPKELAYEYGIPKRVIEGLQALGHKTLRYKTPGSVVCSIHQTKGAIYVNPDYRTGANEHEVY
ncbi:scoloptoxin SSD14-like isoform X2 [Prorops nasuta]|uniref:scoloptoxin SSD14-like isoform X2 n=1 Tax=Prorops nasuta TaxID=863751 RepID=UPI0034CE1820